MSFSKIKRGTASEDGTKFEVLLPEFGFHNIFNPGSSLRVGVVIRDVLQSMAQTFLKEGLKMAAADNITLERIQFTFLEVTNCDRISGMRGILFLVLNKSSNVIFGSNCYENCVSSAQVTDYFNIPYFPFTCLDPVLDDSKVYTTSIRIFGSLTSFGWALRTIFNESGWTKTAIVTESGTYVCKNSVNSIMTKFRAEGVSISDYLLLSSSPGKEEIQEIQKIKNYARIIILCHTNYTALREIIFAAQTYGMTDPNEYVWITFYNIYSDFPYNMIFYPWLPDKNATKEVTERQRQAFVCVKMLTFKNLSSLTGIRDNNRAPRYLRLNYLAELIYIYLKMREKLLKEGIHPNGATVVDACKNQEFQGRIELLTFDDNGDRVMPFLFWSMSHDGDTFNPMYELVPKNKYNYKLLEIGEISWGSSRVPPPDTPKCGFTNELCQEGGFKINIIVILIFVIIIITCIGFLYRIIINRRNILNSWRIDYDELQFIGVRRTSCCPPDDKHVNSSIFKNDGDDDDDTLKSENVENRKANYKGMIVDVVLVSSRVVKSLHVGHEMLAKLKELQHDNMVSFVGAFLENNNFYFVIQCCGKGSLQSVLHNEDIKLEWSFKISFLRDVIKGMAYLHKSFLNYHGKLSSRVCLVTNRWVVKIAGFGFTNYRYNERLAEDEIYRNQLWTAPELLRSNTIGSGSQKGDVYSFAILAYEIVTRSTPYQTYNFTNKEIIQKVIDTQFRPSISSLYTDDIDPIITILINKCWSEDPDDRPGFDEINKGVIRITKFENISIVDAMLDKLEKYATNLEEIVQQRTEKLMEEKKKTDTLLHLMLPTYVAEELKAGRNVEARVYTMATVYFSDIVGFTNLSSQSTPMEIVDLLNDLYGIFDDTIARHNVYKVETIGDAYMVVSGLPQETSRHVVEICNMALDLLSVVKTFKIRHRPDTMLMLRIGIHSGPCAAGVVGHKMPRYCLFGDTVNTASRMESTGEGLKIHLSPPAKDELMKFPGYVVELRGPTELKGKGVMTTYWLLRREGEIK